LPKLPVLPKIAEIVFVPTGALGAHSFSIWILWQLPILAIV
jgi:hypothetical protein